MKVGDRDWAARPGPYSIDNWRVGGKVVPGVYLLLHEEHEIARGHDPVELLRVVDAANAAEQRERSAA